MTNDENKNIEIVDKKESISIEEDCEGFGGEE